MISCEGLVISLASVSTVSPEAAPLPKPAREREEVEMGAARRGGGESAERHSNNMVLEAAYQSGLCHQWERLKCRVL